MKLQNVKITSDGTPEGTFIFINKKPIGYVKKLKYEIDVKKSYGKLTFDIAKPNFEFEGKVRKIEID